ncbi:MAG TPA: cytochrome c biogenesis protein CcsA [Chitinophagaceae bacterium]|nr:cytochrome c biogenesis protein CcsA [Chitinophagaceae bacterium]
MDYIGEHRLPGQLGHFFIVLSLVASLVATFAYFRSTRSQLEEDAASWKRLARLAFFTEVFSVFAIFGILFYIIHNHLFEYKYAWQHSSRALEFKYLLACFWEGQEGSFLLWSVWHCVLGLVLIKTSKKWEGPVMTVVSFAQVCLATMIAGLYIFNWKMGSNPFILLRDSGVLDNAPALHLDFDLNQPLRPDYMSSIKDGNGLNKLLQNYWMVIHPPVLFLGFASTIVPFAFAMAGLWTKKFGEWTKQALPWALFSAAVLGVGIMMGAMWAYESLTFGGYWAWDPVENASLVPWLILIAGIHTLLIYKHSGHSLRPTYLFMILCFGFILYSTFLTRSGVLGETSVHAFTDLGMNWQLLFFLLVFVVPALALFFKQYKNIPAIHKEESGSSREFWMFIGSLVFFLSAIVIIGKTSLPVFNKLFGTKIAPPEDQEFAYNSIQVYIAVIVALLTGFAQYLKYKETPGKYFWKKIAVPTFLALVIATLVLAFGNINYIKKGPAFQASIWLAVACSIYAIITNASYIWLGMKGKLKISGGSISHMGFGLVLLGILISSSKKEVLSNNVSGIYVPLGETEDPRENLTLVQGQKMDMGRYYITYERDSLVPMKERTYFNIRFNRKDGKENFVLRPNSFVNPDGKEGLMSNPDSRHYWDHDVFTYITSLPDPAKQKDTSSFLPHQLKAGDSLFYSGGFMILENVKKKDSLPEELFGKDGQLFETPIKIYSKTGSIYSITSKLARVKGENIIVPDTITSESLVIQLQKVNPDNSIEIGMKESNAVMNYVTLKAYKFPFIKLLWFGVVLTAIGIIISMVNRIHLNRREALRS